MFTFCNERGQKPSGGTGAKSVQQGAADNWRVCVGAGIHHRVAWKKIGGFLSDIWCGAAPYHHLDLVHI